MHESRYNVWVQRDDMHYAYNGRSGALVSMTSAERDHLRDVVSGHVGDDDPARADFLADLRRARVLIPDHTDELALLEARYGAARSAGRHLGLTLVPSLGCNFDCPYCFEAKHPSLMDAEVEQAILTLVADRAPHVQALGVAWFGGEPLVGRASLFRLSESFLALCDAHGIDYVSRIVTNGSLLDAGTARRLSECRVRFAQVTLDGPPDVHDRMRPTRGGRGTFRGIVENLHSAIEYLDVVVRINVDTQNLHRVEELLAILQAEGLAGQVAVTLGHLVGLDDDPAAPSATYSPACLSNAEFAKAKLWFETVKPRYGFHTDASLPSPVSLPCTAVSPSELVIGSKGEMYKCYEHVGNAGEVIGNVRDYLDTNSRAHKWLAYNPFENSECRACIALPVCMGGCANHAFDPAMYTNRCGDFRHTYEQQVHRAVALAGGSPPPGVPGPRDFLSPSAPPAGRRLLPLSPA